MHLAELVALLQQWRQANPNGSKKALAQTVTAQSDLQLDKALLIGAHCVLRISQMEAAGNDSHEIAAFRKFCDHDDRPILVCLLTARSMRLVLANTSLLETVSSRSYRITDGNITGSILDSDILAARDGIANLPENFERLWAIHQNCDRGAEIARIVASTQAMHAAEAEAKSQVGRGAR